MDKSVIISIRGTQTLDDNPPETVELITEGRLIDCGEEGYTLTYQESELTGLEGTLTTFQVEPDCITLLRMGEFNSQMVFQPGRRHFSMYDTPYGALSIGINTRKMRAAWMTTAARSKSITPLRSTMRWRGRTPSTSM